MRIRICLAMLAILPVGAMAAEQQPLFPNRPHPVRNWLQDMRARHKERVTARQEKRTQTVEPPIAPPAPPKRVMPALPGSGAMSNPIRLAPYFPAFRPV